MLEILSVIIGILFVITFIIIQRWFKYLSITRMRALDDSYPARIIKFTGTENRHVYFEVQALSTFRFLPFSKKIYYWDSDPICNTNDEDTALETYELFLRARVIKTQKYERVMIKP